MLQRISVGDGAVMPRACGEAERVARYGDVVRHRYELAELIAAYNYLVTECSRDEAWRRIKAIRNPVEK